MSVVAISSHEELDSLLRHDMYQHLDTYIVIIDIIISSTEEEKMITQKIRHQPGLRSVGIVFSHSLDLSEMQHPI